MFILCIEFIYVGSDIILDVYYVFKYLIEDFRNYQIYLIIRVCINVVDKYFLLLLLFKYSWDMFCIWGELVKLWNLFDEKDCFIIEILLFYGNMVKFKYYSYSIDLYQDFFV